MERQNWILGAGMTGLVADFAGGLPILEARGEPGGICSSYYVLAETTERLPIRPADGEAYRFEVGGGHWIFGGDPLVLALVRRLAPMRQYVRRSSVYFPDTGLRAAYPLQNHLHALGADVAACALEEMARPAEQGITMNEWLETSFGPTLCEIFFFPFHERYTGGFYETIAPQDAYKSPVYLAKVAREAFGNAPRVGYNATFDHPEAGIHMVGRYARWVFQGIADSIRDGLLAGASFR